MWQGIYAAVEARTGLASQQIKRQCLRWRSLLSRSILDAKLGAQDDNVG